MRTTIRLDDDLLKEAKKAAADAGQTLTQLFEAALRERLARRQTKPTSRIALPTFQGTGLQPGIDLDDSSALLDLLEADDASS